MRRLLPVFALALAFLGAASPVRAGNTEPAACLTSDPTQWPAAAKPYFLVIADSSTSMTTAVATANSCSFGNTRHGHARCALLRAFQAFDGVAQFGFATYAMRQTTCGAACYTTCTYSFFPSEQSSRGTMVGCGPLLGVGATTASGASIRVGITPDDFWASPPSTPNSSELVSWVDNTCTSNIELFASGASPLNGSLRDARRYFDGTYVLQDGVTTLASPLSASDYAGSGVNGGTGCRSLNVILLTDGDEGCDTQADAVNAAAALYSTGVTVGGRTYKVRVHVINFVGATAANADAIAAAGGTGASQFAINDTELVTALKSIVGNSLRAETGDNADNNCSSCTDEGFRHYLNTNPTCCVWGSAGQRTTCLNNFSASISVANPQGNRALLPCTTASQAVEPATWLVRDPGETCDGTDNNGDGQVDEGQIKCGSPPACPSSETCNGRDDDCDGQIDEGACPGGLTYFPEICDGCDNNLNSLADDGIAPIPCGQASPPNCAGTLSCKPAQPVSPGACNINGGYNQCSNNPQPETCDGVDNNCNGIVDDNVASPACVPVGTSPSLVYTGSSQCRQGALQCGPGGQSSCASFIGPSAEVCDNFDNDCNGQTDDNPVGIGSSCGAQPGLVYDQAPSQCRSGTMDCTGGLQQCAGHVGPSLEILGDGIDNDCDGLTDENVLFNNGFE